MQKYYVLKTEQLENSGKMKEKVLHNLTSHEHPLLILTVIVHMHYTYMYSCCMCLCLQYRVLFYPPPQELIG